MSRSPRAGRRGSTRISNADIADAFERIADLLATQNGNPFRVRAYANAAERIRGLDQPLRDILGKGGPAALEAIPDIGSGLAAAISQLLDTGRLPLLERLEGEICPEALFTTVPGIGEALAKRIHRELGIDTLEGLEMAAHDGRLDTLAGFGPRRVRAVRETLASMLRRASRRRAAGARGGVWSPRTGPEGAGSPEPQLTVANLLAIDSEYRALVDQDALPRIAPRRFNPTGASWLPLLHTTVGPWDVTALFSNTALAHQLGKTRDWVVIYADLEGVAHRSTVVTERRGALAGLRVVRGREGECQDHYEWRAKTRSHPEVLTLPGLESVSVG